MNHYNSAVHCPIVLKFGRLGIVVREADLVIIKPRATGVMGDLKWQCGANCHLSYLITFFAKSGDILPTPSVKQ